MGVMCQDVFGEVLPSLLKRTVVKQVIRKDKAELVLLQETKLDDNKNNLLINWATSMGMELDFVPVIRSVGGLRPFGRELRFRC